ncbi:MAG: calcium/sodium antiporter [Minwuia sp.]|nr:calcium/sodium antiporter [Minwuia sp.]
MMYLMVAAGLVLLLVGGEALVRGAVSLADRLGVSRLIIGLTVVAFGTSAPELLVCIQAALEDAPGIAIGNVVGSNIANVLLVVGAPALIAPFLCERAVMRREGLAMVGATLIVIVIAWFDGIRFWPGLLLLALLIGFLFNAYRNARSGGDNSVADEVAELGNGVPNNGLLITVMMILGVAGLVAGSHLLVEGAREIAVSAGVPDEVIGVTLVALGTSLPELATSVVAAFRRHGDVAIGNVLGSNLFNILGILGITAMVSHIPVPAQMLHFDFWVMLGAALILFPFAFARLPIGRVAGIFFLAAYAGYVYAQFNGLSGMPIDKLAGL